MEIYNSHLDAEEAPIVAELFHAGYPVTNFWNLRYYDGDKTLAYDIIVKHIRRGGYSDLVMSRLPGALNSSEALVHLAELIEIYKNESRHPIKEGLAIAISEIIQASKYKDGLAVAIDLIGDESNGETRIYFLDILKKSKKPEALSLLKELKNHPTFTSEISSWKTFWKRNL